MRLDSWRTVYTEFNSGLVKWTGLGANASLNRFSEQRVPPDVRVLATLLMGLKCPS